MPETVSSSVSGSTFTATMTVNATQNHKDAQYATVKTVTEGDNLVKVLSDAKDGDVIYLSGKHDLSTTSKASVALNGEITIIGDGSATITGNQNLSIGKNANVTIKNVTFNKVKNGFGNLSTISASGFAGSLIIDNCTFDNTEYQAIQVIPVEGAYIEITNCTFKNTGERSPKRYIQIQSTQRDSEDKQIIQSTVNITITGNTFDDTDKLFFDGNGEYNGLAFVVCNVSYDHIVLGKNIVVNNPNVYFFLSTKEHDKAEVILDKTATLGYATSETIRTVSEHMTK
jgi:pectate lyase